MADNVQIVDHILKEEGPGQYSVYFKELTNTDKTSIQDWLKDNIHYGDVQGAPELPVDNKAYDGNSIKPFDKIAFTADYDDLINAPTIPEVGGERPTAFNPIAFTGVVNLDNVAVSFVINLNEYSINSSNTEYLVGMTEDDIANNNTQLQNIGSTDAFVKGLNAFQKNGTGVLLFNTLQSKIISGGFLITKTPTYLVSNSGIYFLTNVKNISWNGPTLQYFELHLVAITESNYSTIRTYENNISDETATEVLENIELTGKNVILIFDFNNNILYCKTKEIWKEEEPESEPEPEQWITEETDPIFAASPAANITSQDIINWNNKSNFDGKYTSLDPTTLPAKNIQIFYINESDNVDFKYLTENTYCNTTDLYSSSSDFTIENILNDIITTYISSFDSILKIHSFIGTFTILNINNRNNVYTFTLSNLAFSNFNSISQVNKTNSEILGEITITDRTPVLIFDANNHILYIL